MRGEFGAQIVVMMQSIDEGHQTLMGKLQEATSEQAVKIAALEAKVVTLASQFSDPPDNGCAPGKRFKPHGPSTSTTGSSSASGFSSSAGSFKQQEEDRRSLRLSGFPFAYPRTFITNEAKKIMATYLSIGTTMEVHSSGTARSCVLVFQSATIAQSVLDAFSISDTPDFVDPDDQTKHKLSLKHNASAEVRRLGGLMSVLWKVALESLKTVAPKDTVIQLRTDRARGLLLLVVGHRVISLFKVELASLAILGQKPTIHPDPQGLQELPQWLPAKLLDTIVMTTVSNERWS